MVPFLSTLSEACPTAGGSKGWSRWHWA